MVYGTLLREVGHPHHSILIELAEFVAPATFQGTLYDLGEYPGVHISPDPSAVVRGELYRLIDAKRALSKLDAYESHYPDNPSGSLFRRAHVDVVVAPNQGTVRAWVYCYNHSVAHKPRIVSGDYLRFWQRRASNEPD